MLMFFDWMEESMPDGYPFSWENVEDFLEFCKSNEGFEIW